MFFELSQIKGSRIDVNVQDNHLYLSIFRDDIMERADPTHDDGKCLLLSKEPVIGLFVFRCLVSISDFCVY